ncbi:hypothetical protein GCM10009593_17770 [Microlunatus antarcticus]
MRIIGLAWGLVTVAGVLTTRHALTRYVDRLETAATPALPAADVAPPVAERAPAVAVRRVRLVLGALGAVVLLVGAWKVLHAVQPGSYLWLALWLGAAVVLQDGVLAPVLVLLRAITHRSLGRLPDVAVGLVKAGFVIGGLLVLVVLPEIYAQHLGTANPTVLPGDYATRLVVTLLVIMVLTAAAVVIITIRARRRQGLPSRIG